MFYRLFKKEGIGPRVSEDGMLRESFSITEVGEEGVTERELVAYRIADCGCLVSGPEIFVCSQCERIVCSKHALTCGGNIVCLQCCPAGGKPDFFICLSCGLKKSFRSLFSGMFERSKRTKEITQERKKNGNF